MDYGFRIMLDNGDYVDFGQGDYEYVFDKDGDVTALRKVIVNKMTGKLMNFVGCLPHLLSLSFKLFYVFIGQNQDFQNKIEIPAQIVIIWSRDLGCCTKWVRLTSIWKDRNGNAFRRQWNSLGKNDHYL